MCGIAGWYRRKGKPVAAESIASQCSRLIRRGPDDEGQFTDRDFGFGMRRLSIIDVEGGHQPIFSPDGRHAIVLNGEIYNHLDLRRELAGYPFRTRSDTETLLAAFLRWGDDAWLRADGMFAAAVWDRSERTLCLARDPLGIKPLFVTEQGGGLAFASQIDALRVLPGHRFDLDEDGLDDFFCFGHVLQPGSIFRQVRCLEGGHVLRLGPAGGAVVTRYWKPAIAIDRSLSESEWIEETRRRVLETVGRHMLSDVPVGAYVSGGIDSGAIAAAMAMTSGKKFQVFTAGFPGWKRDETAEARRVAEHLGCEHIVMPIEPKTAAEVLPAVQRAFDEPSAANSAIPLWYLSETASKHTKVVLCGEGGDELFLGYKRHRWADRMRRWRPVVSALGEGHFLDHLPVLPSRQWNYVRSLSKRFREGAMLGDGYERFFLSVSITAPAIRARIFAPEFHRRQQCRDAISERAAHFFPPEARLPLSPLEEFELGDLTVHMPASLLQRLDRASMAHSLEARVPFLSRSFVDWALTIPQSMKLNGKTGKYVLRKAVEPWLPAGATAAPKRGFQLPLADWFMGDLNSFAREAWESSGASSLPLLNAGGIERLFDEHRSGTADHGRILYAIAMFSCWWNEQGPDARIAGRHEKPAARPMVIPPNPAA
jgi:asparagine synthase (glutamine-hydrolysing)